MQNISNAQVLSQFMPARVNNEAVDLAP